MMSLLSCSASASFNADVPIIKAIKAHFLSHVISRDVISLRCVAACQSMEHLSWMGLFKEDGDLLLSKLSPKSKTAQLSVQEKHQQVRKKFLNMR